MSGSTRRTSRADASALVHLPRVFIGSATESEAIARAHRKRTERASRSPFLERRI